MGGFKSAHLYKLIQLLLACHLCYFFSKVVFTLSNAFALFKTDAILDYDRAAECLCDCLNMLLHGNLVFLYESLVEEAVFFVELVDSAHNDLLSNCFWLALVDCLLHENVLFCL